MLSTIRIQISQLAGAPAQELQDLATTLEAYLESRDPRVVSQFSAVSRSWAVSHVGSEIARRCGSNTDARLFVELIVLAIHQGARRCSLVEGFVEVAFEHDNKETRECAQEPFIAAARQLGFSDRDIARFGLKCGGTRMPFGWLASTTPEDFHCQRNVDPRLIPWVPPSKSDFPDPMERLIWNLPDAELGTLLADHDLNKCLAPSLIGSLAVFKPDVLIKWIGSADPDKPESIDGWRRIIHVTRRFDREYLEAADRAKTLAKLELWIAFDAERDGTLRERIRDEILARPPTSQLVAERLHGALLLLAEHFPGDAARVAQEWILRGYLTATAEPFVLSGIFDAAASAWMDGGRDAFFSLLEVPSMSARRWHRERRRTAHSWALIAMLNCYPRPPADQIRKWMRGVMAILSNSDIEKDDAKSLEEGLWQDAAERAPALFVEEFFGILGDKAKAFRQIAVRGLSAVEDPVVSQRAAELLASGKADEKLGAAALLGAIASPGSAEILKSALEGEKSEKVRAAIHESLKTLEAPLESSRCRGGPSLLELEALIATQSGKIKLPATSWFKQEKVLPLSSTDGSLLSASAVAFLIFKQSKHKLLEAAPDLLPLLAHIDREKSPPFALALVEGFLNSEQAASDRWALALGGLLGDNRIIPPLLSRIPDWCENSRHKLAEYAAQAIALLPGNEPLMVLDSLSNRYRSKFKNVGKACAEAFNAAAAARGITADELGDMVVPDFGFDGDGIRRFEWDGGGASAELGADFKLSWFDPDTDKAWKSLPANAPAAVKDEVKTLGKLLREAVKAQTARLEMTLVRQRRWPVARWRELFENHPLLRSFASSLVWGIYDASGTLLRTFRRYPNGLLANAAGELEELPEADTVIGMIHPLELETAVLDAWRAHLARFKVKQPFPQIDRPVELMDPLHGNRREIALTKGGKVSAGTFRSRSEKRGWTRGSVVDAGGISSYYKLYPGAGVEVVLPTDNFYIGIDPMDTVELGAAFFAKAGSVERGSYTYDEPAPDEPRVLRFDQVPTVVWSETISDLKAILG